MDEKFKNFRKGRFQKFVIWKIQKIVKLKNSKNLQFGKLEKCVTWKIPKIFNLENCKNFQLGKLQFGKLEKFVT